MATNCESCGFRTNEVKSGSGIEPLGKKITVTVTEHQDFTRDVLKSDTCKLLIPEIDLDVGAATLGGRFTTVEGLLVAIKENLENNGLMLSDAADPLSKTKMDKFLEKLADLLSGKIPFTITLDDPAGNSYVQSLTSPDPDSRLVVEQYERNFQQNEDLGLNDINVDHYQENSS